MTTHAAATHAAATTPAATRAARLALCRVVTTTSAATNAGAILTTATRATGATGASAPTGPPGLSTDATRAARPALRRVVGPDDLRAAGLVNHPLWAGRLTRRGATRIHRPACAVADLLAVDHPGAA